VFPHETAQQAAASSKQQGPTLISLNFSAPKTPVKDRAATIPQESFMVVMVLRRPEGKIIQRTVVLTSSMPKKEERKWELGVGSTR
jgi:hypothetical protein